MFRSFTRPIFHLVVSRPCKLLLLDAFIEPIICRLASGRNATLDHFAHFLSKDIHHSDLARATSQIIHTFRDQLVPGTGLLHVDAELILCIIIGNVCLGGISLVQVDLAGAPRLAKRRFTLR